MTEDRVLRYFLDVLEGGMPENLPHPLALYHDLNVAETVEIVGRAQRVYDYEKRQQRQRGRSRW